MTAVRLLVADDEPLVRGGIRMVLSAAADLEVVAEAGDGEEAVRLARAMRPDLALLDIRMPRLDGISATRRITADPALAGSVRVVLLTTFGDDEYLVGAVRAGASGFLLKSMPAEDLVVAVRAAARGDTAVDQALVRRLLTEHAARSTPPSPLLARLTPRETEVLRELARGRSNAEIAASLYLGEGTVRTHVAAVLRKLQVRDRLQAAVAAYELGLVQPGRPT